jgi:hypothetical protein
MIGRVGSRLTRRDAVIGLSLVVALGIATTGPALADAPYALDREVANLDG